MVYKKFLLIAFLSGSLVLNTVLIWHILYISPQISSQDSAQIHRVDLSKAIENHHEVAKKFGFLSSTIFERRAADVLINFVDLRESLRKKYPETSIPKTGIYFEYLPTGIHIGINDRQPFLRASLVKIPLAMRAYRLIEEGKLKFEDTLTIEERDLDRGFGTLWKRGSGAKIAIRDALKIMLSESDNTAYNILNKHINNEILQSRGENNEIFLSNVYDFLDIPRVPDGKTLAITPRNYTSILKSLYFSSYLKPESSQEILDYLTKTPFSSFLAQNIPSDVAVAHKYAVYNSSEDEHKVTSDCGVVYLPKRPYLLCVMVEASPDDAKPIISDISGMIYTFLASNQ